MTQYIGHSRRVIEVLNSLYADMLKRRITRAQAEAEAQFIKDFEQLVDEWRSGHLKYDDLKRELKALAGRLA